MKLKLKWIMTLLKKSGKETEFLEIVDENGNELFNDYTKRYWSDIHKKDKMCKRKVMKVKSGSGFEARPGGVVAMSLVVILKNDKRK